MSKQQQEVKEKNEPFAWESELFKKLNTATSWLVKDYLETDCLAELFGESTHGKSFIAVDLACHIAHGLSWCGKRVAQGIVLYVTGEGEKGIGKRLYAWHKHHGLQWKQRIMVKSVPIALCEPGNAAKLSDEIKNWLCEQGINQFPVLIIIDTLATNFGDGDENSTKDMTRFIRGMNELRIATKACILVIHHTGHSNKERARGSSTMPAGLDIDFRVDRTGEPTQMDSLVTTLTCTKMKDHRTPQPLSWKWHVELLPEFQEEDDCGDMVPSDSIVLKPCDTPDKASQKRLPPMQQTAFDAWKCLETEHKNRLSSAGLDPATARVLMEDWQAALVPLIRSKSTRNKVRNELIDKGILKQDGLYVLGSLVQSEPE